MSEMDESIEVKTLAELLKPNELAKIRERFLAMKSTNGGA